MESTMPDISAQPTQPQNDDAGKTTALPKPDGRGEPVTKPAPMIADPGNLPTSKFAAPPPLIIGGGIRVFTNVIPKQPKDFCRSFPALQTNAWIANLAKADDTGKRLSLVTHTVYEAGGLNGLLHRAAYSLCVPMIDRDSVPHLWCITMFGRDGEQLESYLTALKAVEAAAQGWHRIWWAGRGWNFEIASNPAAMSYRMPDNLKASGIDAWFEGAFPGRIITDPNAPELKRARGEA